MQHRCVAILYPYGIPGIEPEGGGLALKVECLTHLPSKKRDMSLMNAGFRKPPSHNFTDFIFPLAPLVFLFYSIQLVFFRLSAQNTLVSVLHGRRRNIHL